MTTHRERIQASLHGEIIDRPPVALWRHFPVDDESPKSLAMAQLAFQELYDFDLVKVTPASSFSVRDWGVEDAWQGNAEGTRTYTKRAIREPGDWERLTILEPTAPNLARQLECLGLIRSRLGEHTPLLQTVFNPLAQAKHLAGEQTLLQHLRTHSVAVEGGLRTIAESTRLFIQAATRQGIDGIFYAVQHAQGRLLSHEEFVRFSREADIMLLRSASELWCNVLHLHGEDVYFNAVGDYPAQVINWHDREAGPALEEAGRLWARGLCGGLSRNTLVNGTAKDVAREAAEAFAAPDRGRLILSTGCVVPITAPHGNILAARRASEDQTLAASGQPR
ncbi:MAG: uroporphyrinogen decarboxylase family protein [Chloroflexota bacterium]